MLYLFFAMLCSVGVAHLLRYVNKKGIPVFGVFAVNYAIGSIIALQSGGWVLPFYAGPALVGTGVVMGVLFIGSFFLMTESIRRLGVIIPISLMRIAAVLPTLGSIVLFAEAPTAFQALGCLLAFGALPFADKARLGRQDLKVFLKSDIVWGLALFLAFGAVEFLFKLQKEAFPLQHASHLLSIVFPVAFVIAASTAIVRGIRVTLPMLLIGAVIGGVNYFSAFFVMKALAVLPGIVVYPLNAVGVILLTVISSILLWKERLVARNYVFLALAIGSLVLLYR